jgi:hypothetical protein
MDWNPDILPIAPAMISQTDSPRWRTWRVTLAQAFMGHHKVGAADQKPESSPVAGVAPGQTAGAAPQGSYQPPQRAIPSFHTSRLDGRAEWSQAHRLAKTTRTAKHHAPADLPHPPSRGTDLDDLGVEQVLRRTEAWFRLAPHLAPPSATLDDAQYLEQRRALGFPAIREQEGARPHTGADLGSQRGSVLLRARAYVNPEEKPTAYRECRLHPAPLARAECGMGCIPRPTWHVSLTHAWAMVGLSPLGRALLQAGPCRELHGTNVGRPCITNAPALTLQPPYDGVFGELTPGPQGPLAFREVSAACRTAQPCAGFVRSWPRPMGEVPCAGTIASCPRWMRTRKSRIPLLRWRRLCYRGPPVARNRPQGMDLTPVLPCYYSPGLPDQNQSW